MNAEERAQDDSERRDVGPNRQCPSAPISPTGPLSHDEILELYAAILSGGLVESRATLLAGIPNTLLAELPIAGAPGEQILRDLVTLNTVGALLDGTEP